MAREELDPVAVKRLDVPVAGGSLAVYRLGSANPLVLAVHGITSNSHSWVAVARALERHASLAAVDLRGRGRSEQGLEGVLQGVLHDGAVAEDDDGLLELGLRGIHGLDVERPYVEQ